LRKQSHARLPDSERAARRCGTRLRACLFVIALLLGLSGFGLLVCAAQSDSYAKAEQLVRSRQWDEGLAALAPLLRREPRDPAALNLAGLALIGKGETANAEKDFARAVAAAPEFVPALKNLSISEFNTHDYASAEKHLQTAEKLNPGDPVVHEYLGEIFYQQKACRQAAEELAQAGEAALRRPVVGAHLALCDLQLKEQDKAFAVLDTLSPGQLDAQTQLQLAVALNQAGAPARALPYLAAMRAASPDSYDVAYDLAVVELETKDFPAVVSISKELIAAGHESSELDNLLAHAYEGSSENQQALDAYRRAIVLAPNDEQNYLDLASLCLDRNALAAGLTVVHVGLSQLPHAERLLFMRGLIYATQGDFEKAESDFALSDKLSPQKELGAIGLGAAYLQTGHDAQAIAMLRDRLRRTPGNANLLYLLGESLLENGASPDTPAYVEAQTALEKSTRLNPSLCEPHLALGKIYLDENRNREAVQQFEQARRIEPAEPSAYSHLAVAYRRLGQTEKAAAMLSVLKGMNEQAHQNGLVQPGAAAAAPTVR
jgi:predicted Zn-dependent protease